MLHTMCGHDPWVSWSVPSVNATTVGIVLGVLGIVATFVTVVWIDFRSRLQKDIGVLLDKCRESQSWNDKSELKLAQWLHETPEEDLHNCGLRELSRIRSSVNDYLYIHLYGRDPVPPPGWLESLLQRMTDSLRCRRELRVQNKLSKGKRGQLK